LETKNHPHIPNITLGGSSMEYNQEAGPYKYLVGTEQGVVVSINQKSKNGMTIYDTQAGRHHGPIYSIQRNPIHSKFFMTVGDWTARIWNEDLKSPIMTTKYHPAYLTSGCWSPTRPGVFFVTRNDGVIDIWDYFYRQNDVTYSHKVSDSPLSSIAVHQNGKLVSVGDKTGTISLLQVCDSLATQQSNEKLALSGILERETKREKNLEARAKELVRQQKLMKTQEAEKETPQCDKTTEAEMNALLQKIDEDFLKLMQDRNNDSEQ